MHNNSFKQLISYTLLIGLLIFYYSCSKDNYSSADQFSLDIAGQPNSFIGQGKSIRVNKTSLGDTTTYPPGLPAVLTSINNSDITVQGEIDTTLIAEYNSTYHEQNRLYNKNAFSLTNDGIVKILAGSLQSKDSIFVKLKSSSLLINNAIYLIPVKLKVTDGNATLRTKVYFFKMQITIQDIYGKWQAASKNVNTYPSVFNGSLFGNYTVELINDAKLQDIGPVAIQGMVKQTNKYIPVRIYGRTNVTDTMINYFQKTYNIQAVKFPDNSYVLKKDVVKVNINASLSIDSLSLQITDYSKYAYNTAYVLPIEAYDPGTDSAAAFPDTLVDRIAFVGFKINHLESGNIDSLNKVVTGNAISKTNWTATASDGTTYTANYPKNAIDNSASTYWASLLSTPQSLIINMAQPYTVKGFRFTPQYATIARDFIRMIVYSSSDSVNWKQEGYYFGTATSATTSVTKPDYKYVRFNNAVTAKYFRFYVVKSSYTYGQTSIAEIDAYE